MEEKSKNVVIGERLVVKHGAGAIVFLSIFLALLVGLTIYGAVSKVFEVWTIVLFAVSEAALAFSIGALCVVTKRRKWAKDKPAVVALENGYLKLYTTKCTEETIKIEDIVKIGCMLRTTTIYFGFVMTYNTHDDGTLSFKLKDGRKLRVADVKQARMVKQIILQLQQNYNI